jgi:hypothetical protein
VIVGQSASHQQVHTFLASFLAYFGLPPVGKLKKVESLYKMLIGNQ